MRDAIRSGMTDDELLEIVGAAVGRKKKQHAGKSNLALFIPRRYLKTGLKVISLISYSGGSIGLFPTLAFYTLR